MSWLCKATFGFLLFITWMRRDKMTAVYRIVCHDDDDDDDNYDRGGMKWI